MSMFDKVSPFERILKFGGFFLRERNFHGSTRDKDSAFQQEKEARKVAEKSVQLRNQFLSITCHELKTPLTALQMQVQILNRMLVGPEFEKSSRISILLSAAARSEKQIEQILKLLDELLQVQEVDAGCLTVRPQTIDLSDILNSVVDRYQGLLFQEKNSIHLRVAPSVRGYWDPVRIEQLLVNLLTNAMKYGDHKTVKVDLEKIDSIARIKICDEGIGIAKADHSRIFECFERVNPVKGVQGFGLGLYVCKQIVEAHGGKIWIEGDVGVGSCFFVELPISSGC